MRYFGLCLLVLSLSFLLTVPVQARNPAMNPLTSDYELQSIRLAPGARDSHGLELSLRGQTVTLSLTPYSVRSPEFRLLRVESDGNPIELMATAPATYRGVVVGGLEGVVAATVRGGQLWAAIRLEEETGAEIWYVQPASKSDPSLPRDLHVVRPAASLEEIPGLCGATEIIPPQPQRLAPESGSESPCSDETEIAIEVDYTKFQQLGSDTTAALDDVETLLNAVEVIYARDLLISYSLTTVVLQTSAGEDRYLGSTNETLLSLFRDYWNANLGGIPRDLAHLLTGRVQGGNIIGTAYIGVVCNTAWAYGWSQVNGLDLTYNTGLVAHEIGHNWSATHCNGQSDCQIMCSTIGGCAGILTAFGSQAQDEIDSFRNFVGCLSPGNGAFIANAPTAEDDLRATLIDDPLTLDVLENDFDANCDSIFIASFDVISQAGGSVALSIGTGPDGRDELDYTPALGYEGMDTFGYLVEDETGLTSSADVEITVTSLRTPDSPVTTLPGLTVEYFPYSTPDLGSVPDFDPLIPYLSEIVATIDYPATTGYIAGSGKQDQVGVVFTGSMDLAPGTYTFYSDCDDGSLLYVDDQLVVNNDGAHGMQEVSSVVSLSGGIHEVRVDYFESGLAGGIIISIEGPGLVKQVIPPSLWETPGVTADYYDLSGGFLPAFNSLTSYFSEILTDINFGPTGGEILGSGRSEDVAAVFEGFIDIITPGIYTLHTVSDDGSALYIGDQKVVNNDGQHGMRDRLGFIGLGSGKHSFRLEYFEDTFDGGLIAAYEGPGVAPQIIPAAAYSYEPKGFAAVSDPPLDDPGGTQGAGWGDYDNDGDDDLYLGRIMQNQLLRNDGGDGFVDVTALPLGDVGTTRAPIWADFDDDGDLDLYLVNAAGANRLFRNDSTGFASVATEPEDHATATQDAGWADLDNDGDLDLFLANSGFLPANKLLRNDGTGFVDITTSGMEGALYSYGAALGDMDADGDLDIYVVSDGVNQLFRNDGASFIDVATGPLADAGSGQAAAWADYDNDDDLDLYLVGTSGGKLIRNDGSGIFVDVTGSSGAGVSGDFRGVAWCDFDNDRYLDLYLVNGAAGAANVLLQNSGGGTFGDASMGPLADEGKGRGAAWSDFDGDGRQDLYLVVENGSNSLLVNKHVSGNHWLQVALEGVASNRSGIGARIQLTTTGITQTREVGAGSGSTGRNSLVAAFGLGPSTLVDQIQVHWPSGAVQTMFDVAVDQRVLITESDDSEGFIAQTIAVDGVNDFNPGNLLDDDRGDTQVADHCPLNPGVEAPLDLGRIYLTNDLDNLYFGFEYDKVCFCEVNLGIAIDVNTAAGATTDAFLRAIGWNNVPMKPDYYLYDVVPDGCNAFNYEVIYGWSGASWSELASGPNALGIVDGLFTEGAIPLSTLGVAAGDTIHLEFWVTQEGSEKGPLDASCSDDVQLSTAGGTVWSVASPVQMSCMHEFVILSTDPPVDVPEELVVAKGLSLSPGIPNPFQGATSIGFYLPEAGAVRLRIFDVAGREVTRLLDGEKPAGFHRVSWNGRDKAGRSVGAGIYFVSIETRGEQASRRVVKLR
jgi:hypothetical protein